MLKSILVRAWEEKRRAGEKASVVLENTHTHTHISEEGNGNPLQCSCLENPTDRGAWWAAVYGVAESDTAEWLHFTHFILYHWRRKWQPTSVFLPEESHGQRSLEGHGPRGHRESDTTEMTEHTYTYIYIYIYIIIMSRLLVEVWTLKQFWWGLRPQTGMRSMLLETGGNLTLVIKWQRTWLNWVLVFSAK